MRLLCLAAVLVLCSGHATGLTTKGPHIVDFYRKNVNLKGVAWYGFNVDQYGNFLGMGGNYDSINRDVRTHLWRMQQLGFNSIRLPFSFGILNNGVRVRPSGCTVTSKQDLINSVLHPGFKSKVPTTQPPTVKGGICNAGMPTDTVWNQYVWVVNIAASMGFFVTVDFHSNKNGDRTFYNPSSFKSQWSRLLSDILRNKANASKIVLEPMNEPDGYDCNWQYCQGWGSLTSFYTQMMGTLNPLCPGCLVLVEGGGQANGWSNWGDGFTTNPAVIQKIRGYIKTQGKSLYADATPFFKAIHNAKWRSQVVLSPHVYCPGVTGALDRYAGNGLYEHLDWSFGDKQTKGFNYQGTTRQYAVMLGEFGSTLANDKERTCINSILTYMNNYQPAQYKHLPITSWNFWVWNADSADTGGLLGMGDWRTIQWQRLDLLSSKLQLMPYYKFARPSRKLSL